MLKSIRLPVRRCFGTRKSRPNSTPVVETIDISLDQPPAWFPRAREAKRKVHIHIGPTNSGKTHNALNALMEAKNGIYAGPLRLLAWEVFEKMKKKNLSCTLLTGQEKEVFVREGPREGEEEENENITCCTIEMSNLQASYDVGVIDEAQLIGDKDRGWAWTQALLGLQCKQLHICGSPTFLDIVSKICQTTGDEIVMVNNYSRLQPLVMGEEPVTSLDQIMPGDCVVAFSRQKLYELKRTIERLNQSNRCCVIYGSLPPESRREQALLFGDPLSPFNVLLATDAIGMGLNLAIDRIVLSSITKFNGKVDRKLLSSELKQIAGRAGRFGVSQQNGIVVGTSVAAMTYIQHSLGKEDVKIRKAGLFPSCSQLELLGVLLDFNVDKDILASFWKAYFESEWAGSSSSNEREQSEQEEEGGDKNTKYLANGASAGEVLNYFGSISHFAQELDYFLSKTGRMSSKSRQRLGQKLEAAHSVTTVPLSKLLGLFREKSVQDASKLYFLCDLEERLQLARIIDHLPLRFDDRYIFVMAPVSGQDNSELLLHFKRFASDFCLSYKQQGSRPFAGVPLVCSVKGLSVPRNPLELLSLERLHKVFDLYLWLHQRFPNVFLSYEEAKDEAAACAQLISDALRVLGKKKGSRALIDEGEEEDDEEEDDDEEKRFARNEPHHKGKGGRREREEYKLYKRSEKQAKKRHMAKRKLRKKEKIGVSL